MVSALFVLCSQLSCCTHQLFTVHCPSLLALPPPLYSGCGKTELCQQFQDAGFNILDEAFLDMPEYALHPQSLLMETTWVCAWYAAKPSRNPCQNGAPKCLSSHACSAPLLSGLSAS